MSLSFLRWSGFWFTVTAVMVYLALPGCAGTPGMTRDEGKGVSVASAEERWGIKITALRETAKGHMLDLRYEVTDPPKAAPVLGKDVKPYLVHKRTGMKLKVPNLAKVGPMQQTSNPPVTGVVYFMLFGNDGIARPGDEVSLVIGDAVIDGLNVQ